MGEYRRRTLGAITLGRLVLGRLELGRVTLGVALAAAVGLATGTGPAAVATVTAGFRPAAYPGADGRIAFVRNGNIFTIEPTGIGLRQLTTRGHADGPRWSPNGQRIAYLYRGNLWIMNANGSAKVQITNAAPQYTDGRPTWSPNGRYLAFVETQQHRSYGYLTRYDTVRHEFNSFTDVIEPPHLIKIALLPATAVAWAWARDASGVTYGSFLLYEGTGTQCLAARYCLNALGFPHQDQYRNGYPSAEDQHSTPTRLTDPDWYPNSPLFSVNVITTVENCAVSPCTHSGLSLTIGAPTILPGAYEGVYSPIGAYIAYVRNIRGTPAIYTYLISNVARFRPVFLAYGTEPDWQPVAPPPN
jgi:hypothetical protein